MEKPVSTRHERAAEEFATRARGALGESIHKVILYGSTVRGETRGRDSDVDRVVLNDPEREDELRDIAYDVSLEHGLVVSVQAVLTYENLPVGVVTNRSKAPDTLGSRGSLWSSASGLRSLLRRGSPSGQPLSVPPEAVSRPAVA